MDFISPTAQKWFDKLVELDGKSKRLAMPEKYFTELSGACLAEGSAQAATLTAVARGNLLREQQAKQTTKKRKKG